MSGKSILFTGGAGFIGAHLALRLADENRVTILDVNVGRNAIGFTALEKHRHVRIVEADVRDEAALGRAMADAEVVVHLASLIGVQNVIDHARETIETVVLGTRTVLEAARQHGRLARLVNVSTSEIFGDGGAMSQHAPASVSTRNDPRACYAAAKLLGEHWAWAYFRDFGVPVVNVRPFNVYGPLQLTSNATNAFIARALAGEPLWVHGDGSQLRTWCYIDDFVDGLVECLTRPAAVGEDFNLGNPLTTSTVFDLAQRIVRLCHSPSRIELVPRPFSDFAVRLYDWEKAARLLDYNPQVDLDAGLARTIAWHRQHATELAQRLLSTHRHAGG